MRTFVELAAFFHLFLVLLQSAALTGVPLGCLVGFVGALDGPLGQLAR
jgi:hypothetical protein